MPRSIKKAEVKRTPLRLFAFGVLISTVSLSGIQLWEAVVNPTAAAASHRIPDRLAVDIFYFRFFDRPGHNVYNFSRLKLPPGHQTQWTDTITGCS